MVRWRGFGSLRLFSRHERTGSVIGTFLRLLESDWLHWLSDRRINHGRQPSLIWGSRQLSAIFSQPDTVYWLDGRQYVYRGPIRQSAFKRSAWLASLGEARRLERHRSRNRRHEHFTHHQYRQWLTFRTDD